MEYPFYTMTIWAKDNSRSRTFRIKSNLPFPSPLGTELWVDCGNGFFTEVAAYGHSLKRNGTLGPLYMLLIAASPGDFATNEEPTRLPAKYPHLDNPESAWEWLKEVGWEEFDQSMTDECLPWGDG